MINQLKKPIRDLFVSLTHKQVEAPQVINARLKECSVLLLFFAEEKSDMDQIIKLFSQVQDAFREVKTVVYANKVLFAGASELELILVSQDDFTIGGHLNKGILQQLNQEKVDLLIGLNYNESRWCQHLINELPAHFKAGVQPEMKPSNYHLVLQKNNSKSKISDNFDQLIGYLRTLKIHQ